MISLHTVRFYLCIHLTIIATIILYNNIVSKIDLEFMTLGRNLRRKTQIIIYIQTYIMFSNIKLYIITYKYSTIRYVLYMIRGDYETSKTRASYIIIIMLYLDDRQSRLQRSATIAWNNYILGFKHYILYTDLQLTDKLFGVYLSRM